MNEREQFEAWIRTQEGHPFAGQFGNLMWKAWQARAALSAPPADGVRWSNVRTQLSKFLEEAAFAPPEQQALLLDAWAHHFAAAPAPQPPAEPQDRVHREPTTCGYCNYEEADGSLIEQCPRCKAKDAAPKEGEQHG